MGTSASDRQNMAVISIMRKWIRRTVSVEKPGLVSEESYIEWYDEVDDEAITEEEIRIEGQEK
jgi:hypothetical protein